ncbi:MAG: aminoglycoside 6-adenylyltransferase [Armatimonadota bacterium]
MASHYWHEETIAQLTALLSSDEDVRGVVLGGSCAREDVRPDAWSDVDLGVVVAEGAMARFFPAAGWLAPIGALFACDAQTAAGGNILHVCFTDGRRIDITLVEEAALAAANPFYPGLRVLLSRSLAMDRALEQPGAVPPWTPPTPETFAELCNTFRSAAVMAIHKAARNEHLVALHLSLDLVRSCLLLAMHLRDRETGTNHHRDGSRGNHYVAGLSSLSQPYTQDGILEMITHSAAAFDELAREWSADYRPCREPLLAMVEQARSPERAAEFSPGSQSWGR